jgi:hypothetical protein
MSKQWQTPRIRIKSATCDHYLGDDCRVCREEWERRVVGAPKVHTFREGIYEHISLDPVHISSPQELADKCKENGVHSRYLLESQTWRTKSGKWW